MKSTTIILAATMAVTGVSIVPTNAATLQKTAAIPTTIPSAQSNVKNADSEIHRTIDHAAEYALTPKSMSKLVGLFSNSSQQLITKSKSYFTGYGDKLDSKINSISGTWKQKYGHDFAITKARGVFTSEYAPVRMETPGHIAQSATVAINGPTSNAKFEIPMTCEKGDWKIDVPNTLTADKLRDNLTSELTAVENNSAHWPANETDAYRVVTDHVLRAILDQPMTTHEQASAKPVAAPASSAAQVKPVSATTTHHWWQAWTW